MSADPHSRRPEDSLGEPERLRVDPEHRFADPERLLADMVWMRGLARSLVSDAATADDLTQDAWIAASTWRGAGPESPRRWLATIVRNLSIRRARAESNRSSRERAVAREERLASADDLVARMDMQRRLAEAVLRLSEPYRATVILRYSEDLEPSEIARRQGVPAGTVRSRLKRALEMLREDLDRGSRGDRSAWMSALLPVASRWSNATPTSVGHGVTLTGGMVAMKKVIVIVLALLLASTVWFYARREIGRSEPGSMSTGARILERDGRAAVAEGTALAGQDDRVDRRTAVPLSGSSGVATRGHSPGWWLVGHVQRVGSGRSDPVRVAVCESNEGWPLGLFDFSNDSASTVVKGAASSGGDIEIDLARLFADEEQLPDELAVHLDQPGSIPAHLRIPVARQQRQEGFIPGRRVEFEVETELQTAQHFIVGTVTAAERIERSGISVALLALDRDGHPSIDAQDICRCDSGGRYELRTATDGEHCVVAFHSNDGSPPSRKLARPAHRMIQVAAGDSSVACDLEMTLGTKIMGRVLRDGLIVGSSWLVRATRMSKGRQCSFGPLSWMGASFENDVSSTITEDGGRFEVTGLSPGDYDVREGGPWYDISLRSRGCRGIGVDCGIAQLEVSAPAEDVELSVECGVALWQVMSSGSPVPLAVFHLTGNGTSSSARCDELGRIKCSLPKQATGFHVCFTKAGYSPREFDVEPEVMRRSGWIPVELERMSQTANLRIRCEGDLDRTAEQFLVKCHALDVQEENSSHLDVFEDNRTHKRNGDGVTLEDLLPGRWDIQLSPCARGAAPELQTWVIPIRFQVELAPGEQKTITLTLQAGGRIRIPPANTWAPSESTEEELNFRLLDSEGTKVEVVAVQGMCGEAFTKSRGWGWSGEQIPRDLETELFPSLTPGKYTLEMWNGSKSDPPAHTFDVTIVRGRTVELDVGSDR